MGFDNGIADGQPQAHVALAVAGGTGGMADGIIEEVGQQRRGDALPVVTDGEGGKAVFRFADAEVDGGGGDTVDNSVFNQVGEDLLNEDGVHGDHQQLIRDIYRELDVRQALMGFLNGFGQDFLRRLRPGGQLRLVAADAMDNRFSTTRISHWDSCLTS